MKHPELERAEAVAFGCFGIAFAVAAGCLLLPFAAFLDWLL